jgi:hypothetical protein
MATRVAELDWQEPGSGRAAAADERTGADAPDRGGATRTPNRYRVTQRDGEHVITCVEAPTIQVRVRRGSSVSAAAARHAAPGTIFLDGAAQGAPFLDPKRAVYNLDHHEGCVRPFTLATCEQAMVLVRRIVNLRKRDWNVHANDADLDTILAIWVLLNHLRLNGEDGWIRARITPLLRLEGAIDVHGLDHDDLTGLPPDLLRETKQSMQRLLKREKALRSRGLWPHGDLVRYVAHQLRALDSIVYPPGTFDDMGEIEELARVPIADDSVAVACSSQLGIYEVEKQLRHFHGDRLGLIILRTDAYKYSLRQVDPALPATLEGFYSHLNLLDPAAGGSRSGNRWGGSEEIGGSPRRTGSHLRLQQIAAACQHVYRRPSFVRGLRRLLRAAGLTAACIGAAALCARVAELEPAAGSGSGFAAALALLCGTFLAFAALRCPGLYGLRRPALSSWWILAPLGAIGGLAGGAWAPQVLLREALADPIRWQALGTALAFPLVAEVLFRGLIHGSLAWAFPIQRDGGRWFLSWPVVFSSVLYAPWALLPFLHAPLLEPAAAGFAAPALPVAGALLFGVASGMMRERSESLLPCLLLHCACTLAILTVPPPAL